MGIERTTPLQARHYTGRSTAQKGPMFLDIGRQRSTLLTIAHVKHYTMVRTHEHESIHWRRAITAATSFRT